MVCLYFSILSERYHHESIKPEQEHKPLLNEPMHHGKRECLGGTYAIAAKGEDDHGVPCSQASLDRHYERHAAHDEHQQGLGGR